MYTQCPDCDTAFRVTAEVLKQAAGKVRCGGCGNAFNALAYLSEQKPEQRLAAAAEPELPELKPEPEPEPADESETSGLPKSISAEQSAALLKTLDQLAGSDIRIEDTGIEWRVLDTDAEDANSMSDVFEKPGEILVDEDLSVDSANTSVDPTNTIVDEYLDDAPTPVDEFLTATPTDVDAGEIFEAAEEPVEVRTSVDELRFDDNTPLPEDFEFDEVSYSQPVKVAEPEPEPEPDIEELEVDLTLGEDDDWESLLEEVDDVVAEAGHSDSDEADEVEAPQATPEIVEVDPDSDDPLDMDTQFAIQAEAMGIDLSGIHPVEEDAVDESSIELELEELEALENVEAAASEPEAELEPEPEAEAEAEPEPEAELEPELEAEAEAEAEPEPEAEAEAEAELEPEPESALEEQVELELDGLEALEGDLAAAEAAIDASTSDEIEALELDEFEALDLDDFEALDLDDFADDLDDEIEAELAEEPETSMSDEAGEKHEEDLLEEFEDEVEDALGEQLEEELEHFVPPLSEEEQTINMMIDQDLMALAMEDEDGFASTIVKGSLEEIEEEDAAAAEKGKQEKKRKKDKKQKTIQPPEDTLFETIIMEGEDIRTDKERERLAAEAAVSLAAAGFNKQDDDNKGAGRFGGKWGMIAAAVILGLVLLVQFVHQSRNTLATIPALNSAISPIYRMLGRPLSPEWDVTGWRFEATRGSAEESEGKLNIYSRLGNKSDNALPYPLIAVALTDRFEETIGSKVLEPGDYLADGLDPRKPVAPGNTFSAAISIETPTAGAASFKLNACYREQSGQLRCGLDDFR
jgi:predicted Zn finger-like uncharacterized protein